MSDNNQIRIFLLKKQCAVVRILNSYKQEKYYSPPYGQLHYIGQKETKTA